MKIQNFFACALLLLIAAGAQPAYSAFWQWSKTSATNATADPTINWAEGMAPSSINDSARAMMARSAEQRDDMSGSLTTGGTSTAYTVTSNQGMCLSPSVTPQVGQSIGITMHATNGANATLQVDGCSALPIYQSSGALASGTMLIAQPYTLMFNGAAWVVRDFYSRAAVVTVKKQVFTGSGTYTPSTGMLYAVLECVGGGAGGGGIAGVSGVSNGGGGGGGGGYSRLLASAATIGVSQTVTIGGGGNGGGPGASNGSAGTDTSVGTLCIGKGGSPGTGVSGVGSLGTGGAGGVAGTGDFSVPGQAGGTGLFVNTTTTFTQSGFGGGAGLGFGAGAKSGTPTAASNVNGVAGNLYGGGGSGAAFHNVGGPATGGAGAAGIVVITEYNSQ